MRTPHNDKLLSDLQSLLRYMEELLRPVTIPPEKIPVLIREDYSAPPIGTSPGRPPYTDRRIFIYPD